MYSIVGFVLLIVVVVETVMVIYNIMQNRKTKMVQTSDQDKIMRVKLTLSTAKAAQLGKALTRAAKDATASEDKLAIEQVTCYANDVNERGPTLVEVDVKKV